MQVHGIVCVCIVRLCVLLVCLFSLLEWNVQSWNGMEWNGNGGGGGGGGGGGELRMLQQLPRGIDVRAMLTVGTMNLAFPCLSVIKNAWDLCDELQGKQLCTIYKDLQSCSVDTTNTDGTSRKQPASLHRDL